MIGSCKGLSDQLRELEQRPVKWGKPGILDRMREKNRVTTEEAAKEGLSRFSKVAIEATRRGLPIVLSF